MARILQRVGTRIRNALAISSTTGVADADKIPATNEDGILDPSLVNATVTSAGAADAGKLPQLNGAGQLDASVMPSGIGADTRTYPASEIIASGALVNVWDDTGTLRVRNADGTTEGRETHGFVPTGVAALATATVYFEGRITGLTGLTPGAPVFMSTTPGAVTQAPPSASGNVYQQVGVALDATSVDFERGITVTQD